eukprot:INCI17163.2.p1 GENE.INCI17163.2~~INCI17163.2.p1  ORF type:complete len:268 (-),score=36.52 INCI17163.2:75-878(-)
MDVFREWHVTFSVGPQADVSVVRAFTICKFFDRDCHKTAHATNDGSVVVLPRSALFTLALRLVNAFSFDSGNMPSSVKSIMRDRLVQFCHGATGWLLLACRLGWHLGNHPSNATVTEHALTSSHENCNGRSKHFLGCTDHIARLADVVWKRGVLPCKGLGMCHSTAGNGYSLLILWKTTGQAKFLHQAFRFALHLCSPSEIQPHETVWSQSVTNADHPWSLYEGALGAASFLLDCLLARDAEHHRRLAATPTFDTGVLDLISFPAFE